MKKIMQLGLALGLAGMATISHAALISVTLNGTVSNVSGSYVTRGITTGDSTAATFVYDTDESQATSSNTAGSNEPGHEFSSFYEFPTPPYGAAVQIGAGYNFISNIAGVLNNDNIAIEGAQINNILPDGTYDWLELLGSTTSDGPNGDPASGQEWTLALFSTDTDWITDGSLIPDNLSTVFTPVLLGAEFDDQENEIGVVFIDNLRLSFSPDLPRVAPGEPTSVPVPSSFLLMMTGLMLLARKRLS